MLGDDGLLGSNAPAMSRVNEFIAGVGTDAPDVEEENVFARPSDMWAKTLLETNELEEEDARSGSSSPDSTGSVESSISSHFGGMNYPSLFGSNPSSQTSAKSGGSKYQSTYEGYGSPGRLLKVTSQMMKNLGNQLVQDLEQRSMTSLQEEMMS